MMIFYRACLFLNTVISLLFIIISTYTLITLEKDSVEGIIVSLLLIIINLIFLLFDFICFKIQQYNNQQKIVNKQLVQSGKFLLILNSISSVFVFICIAAAISSFSAFTTKSMQWQLPFYIFFLSLLLICGLTALVNIFFFRNSIKKNKQIVTAVINEIGL